MCRQYYEKSSGFISILHISSVVSLLYPLGYHTYQFSTMTFFRFHQYLISDIKLSYPLGYHTYQFSTMTFFRFHQYLISDIKLSYPLGYHTYQFMIKSYILYECSDYHEIELCFMKINFHHLSRAKT